jgi:tetratricopeptide (TPR) repeat protein
LFLAAIALGGCGRSNSVVTPESGAARRTIPRAVRAGSLTETVQRVEQANFAARTYDKAILAARRDDAAGFQTACAQLRANGRAFDALTLADRYDVGAAERALARAVRFQGITTEAEIAPEGALGWYARFILGFDFEGVPRSQWKAHTAQLYRRVLELDPNFDSADPNKLNTLGYVLADSGRGDDDFKRAERLTRRSLEMWDTVLAQMSLDDRRRPEIEMKRAQLSRDSLAWALHKQGRNTEALIQQERAVEDEARLSASDNLPRTAELNYHLGEIERALKLNDRAQRHYREALKIYPRHAGSLNALKSLAGGSA